MDTTTLLFALLLKACAAGNCQPDEIVISGLTRQACIKELEMIAQKSTAGHLIDVRRLTFTLDGKTYRCVPIDPQ